LNVPLPLLLKMPMLLPFTWATTRSFQLSPLMSAEAMLYG